MATSGRCFIILVCATVIIGQMPVSAGTILVPSDQPTIQAGIDAASDGDTVLVSPGLYEENIDFRGKAISVVSEAGAEKTIIDGNFSGPVVSFQSAEDFRSILTGFTVRHGGGSLNCGGGISCVHASPTIAQNIISDNQLYGDGSGQLLHGGGIYLARSSAVIRDNLIIGNVINKGGGGGIGIFPAHPYYPESAPLIVGNTISNNSANSGGGIYIEDGRALVVDNQISFNMARGSGGGIGFSGIDITFAANIITGNSAVLGGGVKGLRALVISNEISHNLADEAAGGYIEGEQFHGNFIHHNTATEDGGGVRIRVLDETTIDTCPRDNVVIHNTAGNKGGGLYTPLGDVYCFNWLIGENQALAGGGIATGEFGLKTLYNTTISGNEADLEGGGLWMGGEADLVLVSGIVWDNQATVDSSLSVSGDGNYAVRFSDVAGGWPGTGNIDAPPLFVEGPGGPNYLSQILAGQAMDSPCVDSGSASSPMVTGTTRTDEVQDTPVTDMGFHYPRLSIGSVPGHLKFTSWLSGGHDADQSIFIWNNGFGSLAWSATTDVPWLQLSSMTGAVAAGEVDELFVSLDTSGLEPGVHEAVITIESPGASNSPRHVPVTLSSTRVLLVAGPGYAYHNPPVVRLFPPEAQAMPLDQFTAYGAARWGVNVSCGDLNGDGWDVILTGPGPGNVYGPHVRGFEPDGSPLPGLSFLAYGINRYGVNVAAGDMDGDGVEEIITGAGPGAVFGPHVRAFKYHGPAGVEQVAGVNYFAYGTLRWGVNVAAGDIDGDGLDEIITGPGPGVIFGPHVRGWNADGGEAAAVPGVSFFAYENHGYGVVVSCGDIDGDGIDEIVTAPGPWLQYSSIIRGWNFDGSGISIVPGCSYQPFAVDLYGARVYAGKDLDGDGRDEMVVARGPNKNQRSEIYVFRYEDNWVSLQFALEGFAGLSYGANVAAGRF